MIIELNSMRRASLRRSSLGLHRKLYERPSLPRTVILRGFWSELMTLITSSKSAPRSQSISNALTRCEREKGKDDAP